MFLSSIVTMEFLDSRDFVSIAFPTPEPPMACLACPKRKTALLSASKAHDFILWGLVYILESPFMISYFFP